MHLHTEPIAVAAEIVHYADDRTLITSRGRRVRVERDGRVGSFALPLSPWKRAASLVRPGRRLLRTDKCVVVPAGRDDPLSSLVAIYMGAVYRVDTAALLDRSSQDLEPAGASPQPVLQLRQSRVPLHGSVGRDPEGRLYFGEYGHNAERRAVPVYRSGDEGRTWDSVYEFEAGVTKHVHGCYWDPYEEKIWTCTGDYQNESHILVSDPEFRDIEWLGDGGQRWRTCFLAFTPDAVYYGMDSHLEACWICRLDRETRTVRRLYRVPAPIVYGKHLRDGTILLTTHVERGPSVRIWSAGVYVSRDGENWESVFTALKDRYPMPWLKNGGISFAEGQHSDGSFYMFGEGLVGLDGRAVRCVLED